jgi:hypothetical protein
MPRAVATLKTCSPLLLLAAALIVAAGFVGGARGVAYLGIYVTAVLPGLLIGQALFGRAAPAWIAGAPIGYALSALALWVPVAVHRPSRTSFAVAWLAMLGAVWVATRGLRAPLVTIPVWPYQATRVLCALLLLTLALVARPYARIGETDGEGNRRYRAYFTADFIWHEALTAEVARFASPPRNPYLAGRPLQYYWLYFMVPAVVTALDRSHSPPIETFLAVNGLCTGMLLISAVFLAAWAAVPRPRVVAVSVALVVFAWSAEGLYAAVDLYRRGQSLLALRELNIDAITSWYFGGLTIDGLPRSIWYNPQHSLACVLGLVALTIAAHAGVTMSRRVAVLAGIYLGLAIMVSPFPGGALTLIYGTALLLGQLRNPRALPRLVLAQVPAMAAVAAGLAWCVWNRTFEGAGSAVSVGLSGHASSAPLTVFALALGPVLVPSIYGLALAVRRRLPQEVAPAAAGFLVAFGLLFFVTLDLEPIWIGWRAGQVLLVIAPALVALAISAWYARHRMATLAVVSALFMVGLPTALIDAYNAQDTANEAMGAGFRWTVVISPAEQEALAWIERSTPPDALVQMSLNPRGRETWSLIPSLARRRMAAGLPISLLRTPIYEERAARVDRIFETPDPEEALGIARDLRVDYLYVGRVEHEAFGPALLKFDERPDLFYPAFRNQEVAIYAVK